MKHNKFDYVHKVLCAGISPLLVGQAGTGKTTIARQLADHMDLPFYALSLTKQTSVNALIGFIAVTATKTESADSIDPKDSYVPTQFRQAFEHGGVFLLDELDAADANVLLALNTLENGFMSFPDGVIQRHPDFHIIATANPQEQHNIYTGRSKLDFSTLDRYYTIPIDRDGDLELELTDADTMGLVDTARDVLQHSGSSKQVTMRDALRIHQLRIADIDPNPVEAVVFASDKTLLDKYNAAVVHKQKELAEEARKAAITQATAQNIDELFTAVQKGL